MDSEQTEDKNKNNDNNNNKLKLISWSHRTFYYLYICRHTAVTLQLTVITM